MLNNSSIYSPSTTNNQISNANSDKFIVENLSMQNTQELELNNANNNNFTNINFDSIEPKTPSSATSNDIEQHLKPPPTFLNTHRRRSKTYSGEEIISQLDKFNLNTNTNNEQKSHKDSSDLIINKFTSSNCSSTNNFNKNESFNQNLCHDNKRFLFYFFFVFCF